MAVVVYPQPTRYSPFGPAPSPELPNGIWHVAGQATGDASGGTVELQHLLSQEHIFSLEGLWLSTTSTLGAMTVARLRWVVYLPQALLSEIGIDLVEVGNFKAFSGRDIRGIKQFPLALAKSPAGSQPYWHLVMNENINGMVYDVYAWGYYWQPYASQVFGGPRRP